MTEKRIKVPKLRQSIIYEPISADEMESISSEEKKKRKVRVCERVCVRACTN